MIRFNLTDFLQNICSAVVLNKARIFFTKDKSSLLKRMSRNQAVLLEKFTRKYF